MFLSFIASFFRRSKRYVWQPEIVIRDGATAAALGIYKRG